MESNIKPHGHFRFQVSFSTLLCNFVFGILTQWQQHYFFPFMCGLLQFKITHTVSLMRYFRISGLTHCSVHLQENSPKVASVDVQVNSCKTKARVIRMRLQPLNWPEVFSSKNSKKALTIGRLFSFELLLLLLLLLMWWREFCLGVYSATALAQYLRVHYTHMNKQQQALQSLSKAHCDILCMHAFIAWWCILVELTLVVVSKIRSSKMHYIAVNTWANGMWQLGFSSHGRGSRNFLSQILSIFIILGLKIWRLSDLKLF